MKLLAWWRKRRHKHTPEIVEIKTTRFSFTVADEFYVKDDEPGPFEKSDLTPPPDGHVPLDNPLLAARPSSVRQSIREDVMILRCATCGETWTEPYNDFWENL